jgi:hypothetical protein
MNNEKIICYDFSYALIISGRWRSKEYCSKKYISKNGLLRGLKSKGF